MIEISNNFLIAQNQNRQKHITAKPFCAVKLERVPKQDSITFGVSGHRIAEEYVRQAQNLTLKDNLLEPVLGKRFFHELPFNFFFAMHNSQSRHIVNNVPQALQTCGLPLETVLLKLDKISGLTQLNRDINYKNFEIGNLQIPVKARFHFGDYGIVHRLRIGEQDFALKTFRDNRFVNSHGTYGELAIGREFAKAGIADAPHFCIASANPHSAWMLSPFIDKNSTISEGIHYKEFLNQNNMTWGDNSGSNKIQVKNGEFIIDFGGITTKEDEDTYVRKKVKDTVTEIMKTHPPIFEMAKEEGLRVPVLNDFWQTYSESLNTSWARFKHALGFKYGPRSITETPEARFIETVKSKPLMPLRKKESALRRIASEIDVIGDFSIK